MGEERYFIYYTHNGSHHWMNTDSELGVLRFAATQNKCNERDGFECRKIKKVLKVEVIDRYEVRPSFGLYKVKEKGPENPPKKAYRIKPDATCTDSMCSVKGPHTIYNCQSIPRCHNPHCGAYQGTHWTKDCKWKEPLSTPSVCVHPGCSMLYDDRLKKCMKPKPLAVCQNYALGI